MKNPFAKPQEDQSAIPPETMTRWKVMQSHLKDSTNLEKLQPQAAKIIGERIENTWHQWARNSGQIFPEQFRDSSGRDCVRYSGDIKSAFQPWIQDPLKCKLADLTHFQGKSYIRGQEPADVRRSMLLMKNGFGEE
ncbi:MAG: hypothetical protein ACYCYP_01925 [Leptospirales bacterium]